MNVTPGASSAERAPLDATGALQRDSFVLIAVLGVLLVLAILAASLQLRAQMAAKARRALNANAELSATADGMVRLLAYRLGEQRAGATLPLPLFVDGRSIGCNRGDVAFAFRVQDQAGLVDLNSASRPTLERILESVGAPQPQALAAAMIDFRDGDDIVSERGAELAAYQQAGLKHGPKNAAYEAIEELDQVLGMIPDLLRRVLPLVTVHAPPGSLDPAVAPRALRTAFALPEPASAPTGAQVRPGERGRARLYGIEVTARRNDGVAGRRAIIAYVDRSDVGYTVRSWTLLREASSTAENLGNSDCPW
jgi:general secretion pathway protein K